MLELFDKKALATDLGQWRIKDTITLGRHLDQGNRDIGK